MGLFKKGQEATVQFSQQQLLENTIKGARNNILLVLVFSVLNIILLVTNSDTYFLFSAYVPYILVVYGMFFGGLYPEEYYGEYFNEMEFVGKGTLGVIAALVVVALALYVLCWVFSKKNPKGWLIFALVLISIDTALMLFFSGISTDWIMDYVFHGWIIVSFARGLAAIKKLKTLVGEPVEPGFAQEEANREAQELLSAEE